ncbi:SDR family NAD(P)-dependent oxidoreductase [Paractinoplanes hotanensis]|uniref:SDR family oxidoreductase n=1 Tax=Paractinoplanes hotanensis TaxID=2906497 RepID=A0ABT0YBU9_9ACTN|nr:SDR family oxidoreductase [Actinoplanes hotanensis]MCM4083529.1 SDR family oxidoreductase [Actinoplanes hotanensis]
MMTGLSGSVVVVTGAGGLIGSAVCSALLREGATVVAQYRNRPPAVPTHVSIQADLTDEDQVRKIFAEARSTVGAPDGCIAAAATWPPNRTAIVDMTTAEWHEHFTANALMTFLTVREFLADVRSRGTGSLVLMGAAAATYGHPGRAHFAASKSAVTFGLLQSLVDEMTALAPRARVNLVAPGSVGTGEPPVVDADDDTAPQSFLALPDPPSADDVASAVVWLLSPRLSGAVTGQVVRVDAGLAGRFRRKVVRDSDLAAAAADGTARS